MDKKTKWKIVLDKRQNRKRRMKQTKHNRQTTTIRRVTCILSGRQFCSEPNKIWQKFIAHKTTPDRVASDCHSIQRTRIIGHSFRSSVFSVISRIHSRAPIVMAFYRLQSLDCRLQSRAPWPHCWHVGVCCCDYLFHPQNSLLGSCGCCGASEECDDSQLFLLQLGFRLRAKEINRLGWPTVLWPAGGGWVTAICCVVN